MFQFHKIECLFLVVGMEYAILSTTFSRRNSNYQTTPSYFPPQRLSFSILGEEGCRLTRIGHNSNYHTIIFPPERLSFSILGCRLTRIGQANCFKPRSSVAHRLSEGNEAPLGGSVLHKWNSIGFERKKSFEQLGNGKVNHYHRRRTTGEKNWSIYLYINL